MTVSDLVPRVAAVVGDLAPLRDVDVRPDTRLREELGFDSLSLLELAAALEDEFGLPLDSELAAEVADTVTDVAQAVHDIQQAAAG